jgi:DDE superfamily endonuclease
MIPGWPYPVVAALEPGRTSWTAVLDAIRLGPDDDEAEVTAAQVREVVSRLIEAGHWQEGDPPVLVIFDAGYDPMRLACQLADLPVEVLGRLRSDRVLHFPVPARRGGTNGRPPRHGRAFALAAPATWPGPPVTTTTQTTRYGTAVAQAWDRLHPRLTHRSAWLDHGGPLPVIEGTLIRLQVGHLPGDRDPKPVWLWCSRTAIPAATPSSGSPGRSLRICACPGNGRPAGPADPGPGPPGVPEHPRDPALPGRCAETRQTRARPTARIKEPPPGTPSRRGQDGEKGPHAQGTTRTRRLNDKLRTDAGCG